MVGLFGLIGFVLGWVDFCLVGLVYLVWLFGFGRFVLGWSVWFVWLGCCWLEVWLVGLVGIGFDWVWFGFVGFGYGFGFDI